MPGIIVHHEGLYFEYSTISEQPETAAMNSVEFTDFRKQQYGLQGLRDLPDSMERARQNGTSSWIGTSAQVLMSNNHAGPEGINISFDEIIELVKLYREESGLPKLEVDQPEGLAI